MADDAGTGDSRVKLMNTQAELVSLATSRIRGAESITSLLRVLGPGGTDDRHWAVNFQNVHPDARYGTVEFRQHEGCFHVEKIVNRVQLCVALVRWARCEAASRELDKLLNRRSRVGLGSLLQTLGVADEVVEWYEARLTVEKPHVGEEAKRLAKDKTCKGAKIKVGGERRPVAKVGKLRDAGRRSLTRSWKRGMTLRSHSRYLGEQ